MSDKVTCLRNSFETACVRGNSVVAILVYFAISIEAHSACRYNKHKLKNDIVCIFFLDQDYKEQQVRTLAVKVVFTIGYSHQESKSTIMLSSIIAFVVLLNTCHMQMCVASTPNEVYYVKSDGIQHYPCPSGSTVKCKTLAEYLSNQNMYLNNNQVFVFLCGTHNLTGVLEVRDLYSIFLNGSTRCAVNGEDTSVIQCNRKVPSGITFANSTNVHIHNIKMVDCWAPIGSVLSTKHSDRERIQVPDHVLSFQEEEIEICTALMKRSAFPGQIFIISVQAKSQCNGTATPVLINLSLSNKSREFAQIVGGKEMYNVIFSNSCTNFNLKFKLNSDNTTTSAIEVVLSKYPHQKNDDTNISIDLQSCPWGFQLNNGTCECANYNVHTEDYMECDLTTGSVQKIMWHWIGCYRKGSESCQNKVIVAMSRSRSDCCHENDMLVTAEDIDIQCKEGRTGLGCGSCLGNYSVVLGTDNCMKCSDSYLGLVAVYMLAVILLILFLTAFNATVTNGHLNCFIFYANCIYINRYEFFPPFHMYEVTRLMITWLNLDLGIEVCLFNGMTMIQKTSLQLGYVFYMWSLYIIIIFLCRRSTRCTRLFGENVNKVLSTLILLSFFKTGRIVLSIGSVRPLYVVNSTLAVDRKVWLMDPNIGFAEGKHIPLLIVAMFLIVVLLLLTASLLLVQFLARLSGWRCFRWVAKLYPFFETFTGPCTPKYAFWQGLMFAFQILIFLSQVVKASPSAATGFAALTLAILSSVFPKGVYKKRSINLFQLSLLVNLVALSIVHYFLSKIDTKKRATQISIPIAFLSLFIFLLVDNSKKIKKRLMILKKWCVVVNDHEQRIDQGNHVTYSEVYVSSNEHTPLIPAQLMPSVVHIDETRKP